MNEQKGQRKRKNSRISLGEKSKRFFDAPFAKNDEKDTQYFKCTLCPSEIKGKNTHNLAAHISNCHKEQFKEIDSVNKDSLAVKRLKLLHNAVEIVSVNGKPFNFLLASGNQNGIRNKIDKLHKAGIQISLAHESLSDVKSQLHQMAEKVRSKICDEVKDTILCMVLDIGTVNDRSIQGVNLQYIKNGKLQSRSIGTIELQQSHTGTYLAKVCIDRIQEFAINIKQIISITRDNAANLNTMVAGMDDCLKISISDGFEQLQLKKPTILLSAADEERADSAIAELLTTQDEMPDEEIITDMFEAAIHARNQKLLDEISAELRESGFDIQWEITNIKCAAHTLQLGINDTLKSMPVKLQNLIQLCRRAVKFLRLPKTEQEAKAANIKYTKPRIEVVTRWGSMYQMV